MSKVTIKIIHNRQKPKSSYMKYASAETAQLTVEMLDQQLEWLHSWEEIHGARLTAILKLMDSLSGDIKHLLLRYQEEKEQEYQMRSIQDESGMADEP